MTAPSYEEMAETIEARLEQAAELLGELEYPLMEFTAQEFYDYLTGETFTGDRITLRQILGNEYLMLHEVVEVCELKRLGVAIDKDTTMTADKTKIYSAHLAAMDFELGYSLLLEDYYWLRHRLGHHFKMVKKDEHLPDSLKARAKKILDDFWEYRNI